MPLVSLSRCRRHSPSPLKQRIRFPHPSPRAAAPVSSRPDRLKAEVKAGRWDERCCCCCCCLLLLRPLFREEGSLNGWSHRHHSKAGEGTRCRRARTSCQRRTCGHLRFVIGQCVVGRSPHLQGPNRERSQLAPGSEGGRGRVQPCRPAGGAQGLPVKRFMGQGSQEYVPTWLLAPLCGLVLPNCAPSQVRMAHTAVMS